MLPFAIRRLGWAVVLFLVVTLYTYVLFFVVPANDAPVRRGFTVVRGGGLRDTLGLEGSILREYATFVWRILHLDLGRTRSQLPVTEVLADAAPVTISLVLGGAALWLLLALPIGILSALRPRSLLDRVGMTFLLVGVSAHPLWIGLVLSYVFGFRLGLVPVQGYCDVFDPSTQCGGPLQWAYHLLLPWLAFALVFAALYARMIRATVIETLDEDWVRTARAKGRSEAGVLRHHVLRNASLPIVTMLGMDLGIAFGGVVFIERAFGLPGLGPLLFSALARRELPVILGIVVVVTTAVVIFNLVVDLLYAVLDPRISGGFRRLRVHEGAAGEAPAAPAVTVR